MTLTKDDAAAALRDIDGAAAQSRELQGYSHGSSYLFVWGVAWLVAGLLTDLIPERGNAVWMTVNLIAVAATVWLTAQLNRRGVWRDGWRAMTAAFILMGFAVGSLILLGPPSGLAVEAYFGLLTAAAYMVAGLWWGKRYIITGVLVAAGIVLAYVYLREHFSLWFGLLGGGSLILCGVWMRRA
jgi:hypothetical protein